MYQYVVRINHLIIIRVFLLDGSLTKTIAITILSLTFSDSCSLAILVHVQAIYCNYSSAYLFELGLVYIIDRTAFLYEASAAF